MPKFNLSGWRRQGKDPRDLYKIQSPRAVANLSPSATLLSIMGMYLNQGGAGTCGVFTTDEMITADQKAQGLPTTGSAQLFVYWWTRFLMGTLGQDSGVDNRTMMKALNQYGFIPQSMWSYDDTALDVAPTAAMNAAGLPNRITAYSAVIQNNDQMRATIDSEKRPFCFGFDVFPQIESDEAAQTGIIADPSSGATPIGGHDMTLCGYNFSGKDLPGVKQGNVFPNSTYMLRQHWVDADGNPWGDGGYGYASAGYATGPHASDFWVIDSLPGGSSPGPGPGPIVPPPIVSVIAAVNMAFAAVEKAYAGYPWVVQELKAVQLLIVKYLQSHGYKAGAIPPSVIAMVDAAFLAAEYAYKDYAPEIALIKDLVDKYLPMV